MWRAQSFSRPMPEEFQFSYQHFPFGNRPYRGLFEDDVHPTLWWRGVEAVETIGEAPCQDDTGRRILRR